MRLAAIHIRLRRRVDQRIELQCAQRPSQLFRFPKIKLRVIKPNDAEFLRVLAHQRRAEAAASANDNQTLHWPLAKPEIPNSKQPAGAGSSKSQAPSSKEIP